VRPPGDLETPQAGMALTAAAAASRRRALAWLWLALWTAVVLLAGSEEASATATSRLFGPLLHWLLPDASPQTLLHAHWLIRKGAHVAEYGLLALLALGGMRASFRAAFPPLLAAALAWVAWVAACDEVHQALTHSRTGSARDVALDIAAGMLALALAIVYNRVMRAGPSAAERG